MSVSLILICREEERPGNADVFAAIWMLHRYEKDKDTMIRSIVLAVFILVHCFAQQSQPKCNDIIGQWKWFVGPQLTISADHSFTNGENSGNWEMANAAERKYTLRWDVGGFVDEVILSEDGKKLSGTNNQKNKVSGERVGECSK